jgi:hypothetical protein
MTASESSSCGTPEPKRVSMSTAPPVLDYRALLAAMRTPFTFPFMPPLLWPTNIQQQQQSTRKDPQHRRDNNNPHSPTSTIDTALCDGSTVISVDSHPVPHTSVKRSSNYTEEATNAGNLLCSVCTDMSSGKHYGRRVMGYFLVIIIMQVYWRVMVVVDSSNAVYDASSYTGNCSLASELY